MRRIARQARQGWPCWFSDSTRIATAAAGLMLTGNVVLEAPAFAQAPARPVVGENTRPRSLAERRATPLRGKPADAEETDTSAADAASAQTAPQKPKTGIEAAGLKGITPGVSTVEQLKTAWGEPKQTRNGKGIVEFQYEIQGFERVEVYGENDTVSYIVVKFAQPFPPETVVAQLKFDGLEPVVIYDDAGKPMGQAFPERGVVFSFDAKSTTPAVSQLLLEGISAEQFVVRAESRMAQRPQASLADLKEALSRDPKHHRGHFVHAKVLSSVGQSAEALEAIEQAVHLQPSAAQYGIYRAEVLRDLGRHDEALRAIKDVMATANPPKHLQSRALCLQGDLMLQGDSRDPKTALKHYMEAIAIADTISADPKASIRREAKRVLVEAHLGAGHAIALGQWNKKEVVVPRWLIKAGEAATDLVNSEGGESYLRFHVAQRALVAIAASQGGVDGSRVTQDFQALGAKELAAATDPLLRSKISWELAAGLYESMQEAHARGQAGVAMTLGDAAIRHLENVSPRRMEQDYLLGQIHYRLGAEHAVFRNDHVTAVKHYEQAIPLLEKPLPVSCLSETSKHGEAFISMGVSYWQQGDKQKAVDLTSEGVHLVEQAVKSGLAETAQLEIPYANLANMHRELGDATNSQKFADMASRIKGEARQ